MNLAYFAYRLMDDPRVHYLVCEIADSVKEDSENQILFESFDHQTKFSLINQKAIQPEHFKFFFGISENHLNNQDDYIRDCQQIINRIKNGDVDKVVFSRIKTIPYSIAPLEIFQKLNQRYSSTFNYLLSHPTLGTWIGASPEYLLKIRGNRAYSMALAGTKQSGEQWTEKEKKEHQYVIEDIVQKFKDTELSDLSISSTQTITAGPVEHLKTDISGMLDSPWNTLLKKLHPTPATCGTPTVQAKNIIEETEQHNRSLYCGFIGILNGEKKDFFVNLRCMSLTENVAHLYLGGGITKDSDPHKEWIETERKAETLIAVIQS